MSGVSSVDGGYQYFHRDVSDIADEMEAEKDRVKEAYERRADALEERNDELRAEQEDDLNRTVDEIRENSNEAVQEARENARKAINEERAKLYGRDGKYGNGGEVNQLREQLRTTAQEVDRVEERGDRSRDLLEQHYRDQMDTLQKDHRVELEEAVQKTRDNADNTYQAILDGQRESTKESKARSAAAFEKFARDMTEDLEYQRDLAKRAVEDVKRDAEHQKAGLDEDMDRRVEKAREAYNKKAEENTRALRETQTRQQQDLDLKSAAFQEGEKSYVKGRAEGIADGYKEVEDQFRDREQTIVKNYEDILDGTGDRSGELLAHKENQNVRALQEKDRFYANLVSQKAKEYDESLMETRKQFESHIDAMNEDHRAETQRLENRIEQTMEDSNRENSKSLEEQAEAFRRSVSDTTKSYKDQMKHLEETLKKKTTDPNEVNPLVAEKIRRNVVGEYEKVLDENQDRYGRKLEETQMHGNEKYRNLMEEYQSEKNRLEMEKANELNAQRGRLSGYVAEVENNVHDQVKELEQGHGREMEKTVRQYTRLLEGQKRQYDEILSATKEKIASRNQELRQAHQFEMIQTKKDFANRQNEMIRKYEKLLSDQKDDYEYALKLAKEEGNRMVREANKQREDELNHQQLAFDHQLELIEQQNDERTRVLSRNYEQQMDEIRRASARSARA